MKRITLYQIDAFTDKLFGGNPAAVCAFDQWPGDHLMQQIAAENNLAETAFLVKKNNEYEIRWFTPTVEVDLCGHATLSAAFVVFNFLGHKEEVLTFQSRQSGKLKVRSNQELLTLDFPADTLMETQQPEGLTDALGINDNQEVYRGKTDILIILKDQQQVEDINPDMYLLNQIEARGIIVSAPGKEVDFVSRFFGPRVGVPEDPVTGSAHTTLIPYWAKRLKKDKLVARQLSKRGGELYCQLMNDRVYIGGHAKLYLKGEIYLPDN